MTPSLRAARPPRWVIGSWLVSVLAGAALLIGAGGGAGPRPGTALDPATLVGYLQRSAPPDAAALRINAAYGSGHGGAWQFVAHLSWLAADGSVHGGTVELPQQGGGVTEDPPGTPALRDEQRLGWTPAELSGALRMGGGTTRGRGMPQALAMLELEIGASHSGLVGCHGRAADAAACAEHIRSGKQIRTFSDRLLDHASAGPLSVQRAGKPLA